MTLSHIFLNSKVYLELLARLFESLRVGRVDDVYQDVRVVEIVSPVRPKNIQIIRSVTKLCFQ